jgi:hypothetical protein
MNATNVLRVLATKVRLLTASQIARYYCHDHRYPYRAALRLMRTLQAQGVAEITHCVAGHALPWPSLCPSPVAQPAQLDCATLAWRNRLRWRLPLVRTTYITAAPHAAVQLGGHPRVLRPSEREHDMAVASCYLQLQETRPADAAAWLLEDALDELTFADHRPDALICTPSPIVVEVVGRSYRAHKIQSICQAYADYRLWLV